MNKEDNLFKEVVTKNIVSVQEGRLKILETMDITMYGSKAWAFTLQEIGLKKNKNFLFELGLLMGKDAATEIRDVLSKKSAFIDEKIKKPEKIIQLLGFGIVKIEKLKETYLVKIIKNHIIEYGKKLYKDKSMVPEFYRGVYTSFLGEFFGIETNLKIKQINNKLIFST